MDIKINNENIIKLMKSSYYIENLEKPLKSESSYKLQDLINISNKLKIDIIDTNNKKKPKKSLYSEIYKLLS
jgi:phosphate uptake regulator